MNIFVGLSGGVDSSVTAKLLLDAGHQVTGVYMKNWAENLPGFECPWKDDYRDAKRIAVQLGIKFKVYDFTKEYKQFVVDEMLAQFKAGFTPNPDVMCNQEIKFKLFYNLAISDGADAIATGHYAKTEGGHLFAAKDDNKDQTYFLYRVTTEALKNALFPLGNLTKPEVKALAKKWGLITADKKESMGICFVGKVGIKDFLKSFIDVKPGDIIDQNGKTIGRHEGAELYTIGQRHGLNIGEEKPYYVTGKDVKLNIVYVTDDISDSKLFCSSLTLSSLCWITTPPKVNEQYFLRYRHRGKLIPCTLKFNKMSQLDVTLEEQQRSISPGQSAVIYTTDGECLGGGIISATH
jgi:tRNA-specific 2-thiouridylase